MARRILSCKFMDSGPFQCAPVLSNQKKTMLKAMLLLIMMIRKMTGDSGGGADDNDDDDDNDDLLPKFQLPLFKALK